MTIPVSGQRLMAESGDSEIRMQALGLKPSHLFASRISFDRGRPQRRVRVCSSKASAKDVIVRYYDAYNAGDIDTIDALLAEDVSYHDMIYEEPFRGR